MVRKNAWWSGACLLIVTACGSTAPLPPEARAALPAPADAAPMTSLRPDEDVPAARTEEREAALRVRAPGAVVAADLPDLPASGRPASRGPLPTLRSDGVDERVLRVGIATSSTLQSGADHLPVLRAVESFVNDSGGVAGRRLDLVVAEVPSGTQDQFEARQTAHQQSACAALTQDASVLAVLNLTKFARYGLGCYIDAGVPSYALGMGGLAEAELRRSAQWLLPGAQPHLERVARELPALLAQQSALGTRIGILGLDLPQHRDLAERVLIPGLERVGGNVVATAFLQLEAGPAGPAAAALRFKADAVDRVVLWLGGEGPWLYFAQRAEDQGYRPQYAFTTLNFPFLAQTSVPASHLERAVGIGWDANTDGVPASPRGRGRACIDQVSRRTGGEYVAKNALAVALVCEQLLLLQDALRPAAGRVLRRTDVAGLYRSLGEWQPVAVPLARFRPDKLDGAAVQAVLRYDPGAKRFRYTTPWRPWPDER